MGWRELRQKARRTLHQVFKVAALYYPPNGDPFVALYVRAHDKTELLGDLSGTNFNYAERVESTPSIIFVDPTFKPARGAVVMISPTEGYRLEYRDPKDDISYTSPAVRLTEEELLDFESPDLYPELFG